MEGIVVFELVGWSVFLSTLLCKAGCPLRMRSGMELPEFMGGFFLVFCYSPSQQFREGGTKASTSRFMKSSLRRRSSAGGNNNSNNNGNNKKEQQKANVVIQRWLFAKMRANLCLGIYVRW